MVQLGSMAMQIYLHSLVTSPLWLESFAMNAYVVAMSVAITRTNVDAFMSMILSLLDFTLEEDVLVKERLPMSLGCMTSWLQAMWKVFDELERPGIENGGAYILEQVLYRCASSSMTHSAQSCSECNVAHLRFA